MAETADGAVLAAGAQAQDTQSLGNDNTLLLVVGRGNTLEHLQALHGGGTAGGLVRDHAADSLVEDTGGSAEVEGTTASGVETSHLAEVGVVLDCWSNCKSAAVSRKVLPNVWPGFQNIPSPLQFPLFRCHWNTSLVTSRKDRGVERTLRAEELAGDVEGLTSHNDDLLAVKQLLGNSAGQATKEVSLAVDDDLFQSHSVSEYGLGLNREDDGVGKINGVVRIKNAPLNRRRTSCSVTVCKEMSLGWMVVGGCCRWSQVNAHNEVRWIAGEGAKRATEAYCVWISLEGRSPTSSQSHSSWVHILPMPAYVSIWAPPIVRAMLLLS